MEITRRLTIAVIAILGIALGASLLLVFLSFGSGTGGGSSGDSSFPFVIFIPIFAGVLIPFFAIYTNNKREEALEE